MHMKAKPNEYQRELGPLYDAAPKAVFAAVVVSLLSCGGDDMAGVAEKFRKEWETLHDNGIVPQRAPAKAVP